MELGVGQFLEKFENHFGSRWTKALLLVVGLGVASVSLTAVWQFIGKPLWSVAYANWPRQWTGQTTLQAFFIALQIGAGMAVGSIMLDAYRRRIATDEVERLVPRTQEVLENSELGLAEARALVDHAQETMRDVKELVMAATLGLDEMIETARKTGLISDADVKTLEDIRDGIVTANLEIGS